MQRVLFVLAAVGFLVGSLSWLAGARRAYHRALAAEHRGLQAAQWRSLAAKDGLAGALLLSLVPVMVAEAVQGRALVADWVLLLAVVPLLASLGWIRRFNRLAGLIEAEADYAQRQRERTAQEEELAHLIASRLGASDTHTHEGIVLRTLFHPVEGQIGGDFVGTAVAGEDVLFVVGDVSGHGLEAAVEALRLKDLVLSAAVAGWGLADALALANAHLWATPWGRRWPRCLWAATAKGCCATPTPAICPATWSAATPISRWRRPARYLACSNTPRSRSGRWRCHRASGWWCTPTGWSRRTAVWAA